MKTRRRRKRLPSPWWGGVGGGGHPESLNRVIRTRSNS